MYYGDDESEALCSGWPDQMTDSSFCKSVNASRAFFILAIAVDLFATVVGMVNWIGGEKFDGWADEQMFVYIASGVFGMTGWIVWMAKVDKDMSTMLRTSMLDSAGARGTELCVRDES